MLGCLSVYKALSFMLPCSCRFYPSCSQYCRDALNKHGIFRGLFLTVKRILRCNPLSFGGYDPVK
ncbi:MAG: membrane protein insertion efficiency factor YidD [Candidatus Dadabacteria bacterium]|nr:membrane protein insertion efficiency factor YidD [Candidatus Dadabacteria bacterium]NIS09368.1 membrane protein insertion efficiency factor YidD [Candidatus Dadabacteria bacterium]NIV42378.1 membrane protein insertion efficiency factor YidD [Candidatus Dadabacteria bacterium]NIX15904.1 membrane protein insertion efficiency factor YidD [Candidatus Dadabacteria bacterium]NIY22611.1 membrane protein insertion efficiency factor YidD [Candidatus Dadabacteria bacterium]